jgi:hypothetical protein
VRLRTSGLKSDVYFAPFEDGQIFDDRTDILRGYRGLVMLIILLTFAVQACFDNDGWFKTMPAEWHARLVVDRVRLRTRREYPIAVGQISLYRLQFE